MQTEFKRGGAYRFDEQTIRDAVDAIHKFLGLAPTVEFEFGAKASSKETISSENLDEMFNSILTRTDYITELRISGTSLTGVAPCSAYLEVGNLPIEMFGSISLRLPGGGQHVVRFVASGSPDGCALIKTRLDHILDAARPSYSWLHRGMKADALFAGLLGAILALGIPIALERYGEGVLPIYGAIMGLAGGGFASLRDALFPRLTFDVGRSKSIYERAVRRRNLIFKTVLLGTVIGVVAGLILQLLV